jgi:hypothetical protein
VQEITVELGWLKRVMFSRDANAQIDGARQLDNCVARKVGVAAGRVGLLLSTGCPAGEN